MNFDIYAFTVLDYTKRDLSFEEDAERALLGVLDVLARLQRGTCIFGIPDTAIEAGLMWCPIGSAVRRLDAKGQPLFPSWSWLGWKGKAGYPWLTEREFPLSCKGSPLLWEDVTLNGNQRWFTSIEYRHSFSPTDRHESDLFERWELDSQDPWAYSTDFQEGLRWIYPVSQDTYLGGSRAFSFIANHSHHLRFHTLSAHLRLASSTFIRRDNFDHSLLLHHQRIIDSSGFSAGYIYTPDPTFMTTKQRESFRGHVEFVVLSRASINSDPRVGAHDLGESIFHNISFRSRDATLPPNGTGPQHHNEHLHDLAYFNTDRYDDSNPWCLFNVLMIEWTGNVAQRVTVGRVHINAFLSADPVQKHICLE